MVVCKSLLDFLPSCAGSLKPGVSKPRPAGHLWPAQRFNLARQTYAMCCNNVFGYVFDLSQLYFYVCALKLLNVPGATSSIKRILSIVKSVLSENGSRMNEKSGEIQENNVKSLMACRINADC